MTMTRQRRSLTPDSIAFLLEELAAISRSPWRDHRGRIGRLAITFRPCKQGRDGLPDHPIPFDEFRLLALSYGWAAARRGWRPKITLAIYRATIDRKDPVPIRFRPEQVHDLIHPRSLMAPRPNATLIRSGLVLHQAIADTEPGEFAPVLEFPRFFYGFRPSRTPDFAPIRQAEADASERTIDGLKAWPAELFAGPVGGRWQNLRPKQVFASLAHLKNRVVQNPAFSVLKHRHHGLLPPGQDYRNWLATVSRMSNGVRVIDDPSSEQTEAGRLRRLIASYVIAEPAREAVILADLQSACTAMGVKIGEGAEGVDQLARLLDSPWTPAAVPYAARVQKLGGSASRKLTDGVSFLDLDDLSVARSRPDLVPRVNPGCLPRS